MGERISAVDFCRFIWESYLVERRYDYLDEIIDNKITVIGTGQHETSRNREEFVQSMQRESQEWEGNFTIKSQWYQETKLSDTLSLVMGEILAKENGDKNILLDVNFRFSVILEQVDTAWKVVHIHQSVPDFNQGTGEFFPHHIIEKNQQEVLYNLRHDSLTGLLNRLYLKENIRRAMKENHKGLFLMMDVDHFKQINDTYGHPFGDKVLILLAQSLKCGFAQKIIGRIGGDEFIVYLDNFIDPPSSLDTLLEPFYDDWHERQQVLNLNTKIAVSIGFSVYPDDGNSYEQIWKKADQALYKLKNFKKSNAFLIKQKL